MHSRLERGTPGTVRRDGLVAAMAQIIVGNMCCWVHPVSLVDDAVVLICGRAGPRGAAAAATLSIFSITRWCGRLRVVMSGSGIDRVMMGGP